jgi:hypothetical protein
VEKLEAGKAIRRGGVEGEILFLRDHRVILDEQLARLYGVEVRVLNQAVKRNIERFPGDFMFQLTAAETARPRSQLVTLDATRSGRGAHRKFRPFAFTEQGVAMLWMPWRRDTTPSSRSSSTPSGS